MPPMEGSCGRTARREVLVVDGVLLLPGLQRDADEHLGGPAPVLLALVDVCKVLTDRADLIEEAD